MTRAELSNDAVKRWLNGIQPVWQLLEPTSLRALLAPPSPDNAAVQLNPDLSCEDVARSAIAQNAIELLHHAADKRGLPLTATGNLSRAVVESLLSRLQWPDFDRTESFRLHKVINEPDALHVYFLRVLAQSAKLLRAVRGKLALTKLGRETLARGPDGALQTMLFYTAFWHLDLAYFDLEFGGSWPQDHIGVVLWAVAASASDWQLPATISRTSTIPIEAVVETPWDTASHAVEARVLRPLFWFGVLEQRTEKTGPHWFDRQRFYRKSSLFDRLIQFDVRIEPVGSSRH